MPTCPRIHIQILDVYPSIRCKVFQSLDIWSQYPFHSLCNGGVALENMSNRAGNEKDGNFVKLLLLNHSFSFSYEYESFKTHSVV